MPDDDKPATTDVDVEVLMQRLFPVDTDAHVSGLFAMEKRTALRIRTGYSRASPQLVEKMTLQAEVQDRLLGEIEAAIRKAIAAGAHPYVLRYALRSVMKSDLVPIDSEPL